MFTELAISFPDGAAAIRVGEDRLVDKQRALKLMRSLCNIALLVRGLLEVTKHESVEDSDESSFVSNAGTNIREAPRETTQLTLRDLFYVPLRKLI